MKKAKPVPESVHKGSGEKERLQQIKEENRKKALVCIEFETVFLIQQENYEQAQKEQFSVAQRGPIDKLEKLRKEVHNAQQEEFERNKPIVFRKIPSNIYQSVPIKLTTAAILREDALVRKQKAKEEKWLQDVEIGLKDEQEFEAWRQELMLKGTCVSKHKSSSR